MKDLILSSSVTSHQKIMLYGFALLSFLYGGLAFLWVMLSLLVELTFPETNSSELVSIFVFFLSFLFLGLSLLKSGLSIEKKRLFKAFYLFKRRIWAKEIDLKNIREVSIFKYNVAQKYALGASPNPEQTMGYQQFRTYLLNENHSAKTLLFSSPNLEQAEMIVSELKEAFDFKHTTYNPPRITLRR